MAIKKMKKLDISTWNRNNHFNFYKDFTDPCFNICSNIDVTSAVKLAKQNNKSIFLTLLFLSNKATNDTNAFKLRLDEHQQVWIIDKINPSVTILREDDTFNFCYFRQNDNLNDFIEQSEIARDLSLKEQPLSPETFEKEDYAEQIFYSVIPWLNFTSFKHAFNINGADVPLIVFGKIHPQGEKLMMPVSVQMHHALADAIDIAKYKQRFQRHINMLDFS